MWLLPRSRHQRGRLLHELQRRHHQVRSRVAPGGPQLQHHLPERRRLAQDHRGQPGCAADREDPHAPGAAGRLWTQERACARSFASGRAPPSGADPWRRIASGLRLPNRERSGDPAPRGRWSRLRSRLYVCKGSRLLARGNPRTVPERERRPMALPMCKLPAANDAAGCWTMGLCPSGKGGSPAEEERVTPLR